MAARPSIMPPHNETEHTISRITREGKQLTYKLSVMQQPERARACGAGAKCRSSINCPLATRPKGHRRRRLRVRVGIDICCLLTRQ